MIQSYGISPQIINTEIKNVHLTHDNFLAPILILNENISKGIAIKVIKTCKE